MNTSVISIKGGLGNQLFQYAYGKYLAKHGYCVAYNIDWYLQFAHLRKYLLPEVIQRHIPLTTQQATHDGYWQELKYTEPVKSDILNEINQDEDISAIAMHVRRGDYVGHKKYVNLSMDYYEKAYIELVKEYGELSVILFSDDLNWCAKNMMQFPKASLFNADPVMSFEYMRRCRYKIIANSTFSWWAAYTSAGKVIAPGAWYKDRETNILPKNWIRL